jgi:hypothetical protein
MVLERRTLPIVLPLLVVALACGRQGPPQVGGEPIPADEGALGVAFDPGSDELVFELDPVDLPANSDHHGVEQPAPLEGAVTVDGWVHGYSVELVDKDGQPVPKDVLHHVNIIIPGRRELFSPIMQRLGAAGHETSDVSVPGLLGYPLNRGETVLLSAMMYNPTNTSYEGVRVRVRMPHISRDRTIHPIRVYPFYLDVMPPAGIHEFDLPPGTSEKAWEGRPAVSGRIVGMGGHVHKYATTLRLEDLTADKLVYETKPILDEQGNVVGMPQDLFALRLGIPIDREHTYRLVVKYDNPTGAMIPGGGMGALGGAMIPSGDEEWPTIDPNDADYKKDVRVTMRLDGGHMTMMNMNGPAESASPPAHSHDDAGAPPHKH